MKFQNIKGVVYDLDGTIISSDNVSDKAWVDAAKKFEINFTEEMVAEQKGIPMKEYAKKFGEIQEELSKEVNRLKQEYAGNATMFEGFFETKEELTKRNIDVKICTSAKKEFVEKVRKTHAKLKDVETTKREDYEHSKPSPEPLLTTFKKMNLKPEECIYVGDAFADYQAANAAGCGFIYFCQGKPNENIPETTPKIKNHKEILDLIAA